MGEPEAIVTASACSDRPAIRARAKRSSTGVLGISGNDLPTAKPKTGVYGYANQDASSNAYGRIKADKVSGVATIAAGSSSVTVSPGVNVTAGSFVLLTPKANIGSRGLWFSTNPTADSITIHMSSTRTSATKVAWLLLG